jgi:hypothetical protein
MDKMKPNSEPETLDAPSTFGGRRPSSCSAESLFDVMGEAASAHLTAKKVSGILDMGVGWQVSGFVLYQPDSNARVIVEMSAVRRLTNEEMWWLMHDSAQHDRQLLPNIQEQATGEEGPGILP